MNKNPLVSVIIPSYNHEKYIINAIDSVISQTYQNIELIVIDDGSKDGSIELLTELAEKKSFHFTSQSNIGVCKTLNRGIRELSKGDYVALLASDDYWQPTKIEKQIKALKNNKNSQFCFSQAQEFASDSGKIIRLFPAKPLSGKILNSVFIRQHVPAGSMLFSRKLYDEIGGFDENLREEDWDFVIRAAAETEFTHVAEPLLMYRTHTQNTMITAGRRKIFQQKAFILAKNYHLVSPNVWLRAILLHYFYDHIISKISDLKFIKRFL